MSEGLGQTQGPPPVAPRLRRCLRLCVNLADALLCHDDELEGRRIAFILYLVPPWDGSLGGTLDLYDVDGKAPACSPTPTAAPQSTGTVSALLRGDGAAAAVAAAGGPDARPDSRRSAWHWR